MDFLDSLEINTPQKKSSRVRSWYLYEQFKSLERNQIEAAQKLKERSFQEKILHREINERRARRKLYDHEQETNDESKVFSNCTSELFESLCEIQDDQSENTDQTVADDSSYSQDDSQPCTEDYKVGYNYAGSNDGTNFTNKHNLADDIKEELESVKKNIADNINLQLQTVGESLQCLEKKFERCNDGILSETESDTTSYDESEIRKITDDRLNMNNVIAIWSKLVSFAYQVIKLNHGNCYSDYSSQFLTVVLACDVLRRGINKMCHILQPYVSPIKFATDSETSSDNGKKRKRKKSVCLKKCNNKSKGYYKLGKDLCNSKQYHSVNNYKYLPKKLLKRRPSNSLYNAASTRSNSNSTIWPRFSRDDTSEYCSCECHTRVTNPMLKITQYLDHILNDIEEFDNI